MTEKTNLDLNKLLERKSQVEANIHRMMGRLEAARKSKAEIEEECDKRGLDPNSLQETLEKLEKKYTQAKVELDAQLTQMEEKLEPFLEKEDD